MTERKQDNYTKKQHYSLKWSTILWNEGVLRMLLETNSETNCQGSNKIMVQKISTKLKQTFWCN